jgi:hypothetical protein
MNKIAIYALAIALFLGVAYWWHDNQVDAYRKQIQVEMTDQYNDRLVALQNKADDASLTLAAKLKENTNATKAEIAALNSRHAAIVAGLRKRPERPTSNANNGSNPGTGGTPQGNTGVQLYRPDAEFLVWFSRDTAELQAELKSCRIDYGIVKNQLEKFVNENPRFVTAPVN